MEKYVVKSVGTLPQNDIRFFSLDKICSEQTYMYIVYIYKQNSLSNIAPYQQ